MKVAGRLPGGWLQDAQRGAEVRRRCLKEQVTSVGDWALSHQGLLGGCVEQALNAG